MTDNEAPKAMTLDVRDLMIEAKFNIRPGETVNGELIVEQPYAALGIGKFLKSDEAMRLATLIEQYANQRVLEAKEKMLSDIDDMPVVDGHLIPYEEIEGYLKATLNSNAENES